MSRRRVDKPQFHSGEQHPPRYRSDLNPNAMAGQNVGEERNLKEEHLARSAYDRKDVHRAWHTLPDDTLKQVPVLPSGARLQQGATYLDLAHPERGEQIGLGDRTTMLDEWMVPKDQVPYWVYNQLRGLVDQRRLDQGPNSDPDFVGYQ
jgi:hypothetical protein